MFEIYHYRSWAACGSKKKTYEFNCTTHFYDRSHGLSNWAWVFSSIKFCQEYIQLNKPRSHRVRLLTASWHLTLSPLLSSTLRMVVEACSLLFHQAETRTSTISDETSRTRSTFTLLEMLDTTSSVIYMTFAGTQFRIPIPYVHSRLPSTRSRTCNGQRLSQRRKR